jgi:hypothetical protein
MIARLTSRFSGAFVVIVAGFLGWFAIGPAIEGCAGAGPIVKTVLDATQLACTFESTITSAPALADACQIDHALVPILENIIGEREAAAKAGVRWRQRPDGGSGLSQPHILTDAAAP